MDSSKEAVDSGASTESIATESSRASDYSRREIHLADCSDSIHPPGKCKYQSYHTPYLSPDTSISPVTSIRVKLEHSKYHMSV